MCMCVQAQQLVLEQLTCAERVCMVGGRAYTCADAAMLRMYYKSATSEGCSWHLLLVGVCAD